MPESIAVSPYGDSLYVANFVADTISIIDPAKNKVVAGVTLDLIPFRGGQIICDDLNAPINRYFYVSSGTECIARPNNGFEFDSWVEIFDGNSTRTISVSTPADSALATLLDSFSDDPAASSNSSLALEAVQALRDSFSDDPAANLTRTVSAPASSNSSLALEAVRAVFTDDPAAILTVNKYGNFTAYFKALPSPVPAEFTVSLITVIVAAFVGSLLIPAVLSWFKSKKQTSRLNSFHQQMDLMYADRKLDKNETDQSNRLNKDISDTYAAGKISNEQYTHLKNEVSTAYQEIFKKRIKSLTDANTEAVSKINNDIMNAYSTGRISNELFTNLKNEISVAYQEIFKKRIKSITERNTEDLDKIKIDIRDAYSTGKLSNEHYTDLKDEVSNVYQKIYKKRIESLTDPDTKAISTIKNNIRDAYADGKITEMHFKLLNEKISDLLDKK